MPRAAKTRLFLLFALLIANFDPHKCSPLLGCDPEDPWNSDSYYEERRQELSDEIEDVNDYMRMVADRLTDDGVVVVRALKTRITTPDSGDAMKPDILILGAGDQGFDRSENSEIVEIIPHGESESQDLLSIQSTLPPATEVKKSFLHTDDVENESLEGETAV